MSNSNLDFPPSEDALDATSLAELVDDSAVANAMAEIDSILLATSRDAFPPAHTDDEATRASTNSHLPSVPSSGVSEAHSSAEDDLDGLVPPTPDGDLPLDVAAILDLDGTGVSETPQREASMSSEEQLHLALVEQAAENDALLYTPPPADGSLWTGAHGGESPRSFLARVKALRDQAALSASARSKKMLAPRRPAPTTPRRPARNNAVSM